MYTDYLRRTQGIRMFLLQIHIFLMYGGMTGALGSTLACHMSFFSLKSHIPAKYARRMQARL